MNLQQLHENPVLRQKLAAEYVLGTLRGGARRRFEGWLKQDAQLLQQVRIWEGRLIPMSEFAPPVHPSPELWERIADKTIDRQWQHWYQIIWMKLIGNLSFWRGVGVVSTALCLILLTMTVTMHSGKNTVQVQYLATLTNEQSQPVLVITASRERGSLNAKVLQTIALKENQSLEMWSISKEGKIRSLGLIRESGEQEIQMPEYLHETEGLIAVSVEPKGGSGNPEKPSGPVILKGNWIRLG
ncbi:anti-sigma factor [Undibacterium luofuense]|mgnify:CR=1 FL=1|uniref:anti-sigma factor n=1 Tax=Undibacterium luofuense TaxID=2828733 RepID=UPI0030EC9341